MTGIPEKIAAVLVFLLVLALAATQSVTSVLYLSGLGLLVLVTGFVAKKLEAAHVRVEGYNPS